MIVVVGEDGTGVEVEESLLFLDDRPHSTWRSFWMAGVLVLDYLSCLSYCSVIM
jgi:hypothetical protein